MRCYILVAPLAGICTCGCSRPADPVTVAAPPPAGETIVGTPYGDFVIGKPVSHENLTIFPISSKTPKNSDRFLTLDEGLAAGAVKIIEVGAEEVSGEHVDPFELFDADTQPAADAASESEEVSRKEQPQQVKEAPIDDLFGPAPKRSADQEAAGAPADAVDDDPFGGATQPPPRNGAVKRRPKAPTTPTACLAKTKTHLPAKSTGT